MTNKTNSACSIMMLGDLDMANEQIVHGQHGFHQALLDLVAVHGSQRALFILTHDVVVGIFAERVAFSLVTGDFFGRHVLRRRHRGLP